MKQKTLLLFQLFLALFAFYSVLQYTGNQRLIVPLTCLFGMFVVGKVESRITESEQKAKIKRSKHDRTIQPGKAFKPVDCLLKSKNVLLLSDAIHYLLKDLGLNVSRSPDQSVVDRLVKIPEDKLIFGLKVLSDVGELDEDWESWEEVADFDAGHSGERRILLIGSNTVNEKGGGKPQFGDFSASTQNLLSSKSLVAMTTITLYKIYVLCQKKSVDPKAILNLVHRHPGGVFRLEQYMKGANQAA
jgi:hypothetical protein